MPPLSSMRNDAVRQRSFSTLGAPRPNRRSEKRERSNSNSKSNPMRTQRKYKTVTFSPTDELQEIPHINDLSDEEVSDVWMTRAELQGLRRQCAAIVKFIDMESAVQHGVCLRGLEQNTPAYVAVQVTIRSKLYDAVYAIQHFQLTTGTVVTDLLSETCQQLSHDSVLQAQIVGMLDAIDVQSTL